MSDNINNNDNADMLFATKRRKQLEETAEKERLEELERKKKQVTEEIRRLESLRAIQEEEARQKAAAENYAKAVSADTDPLTIGKTDSPVEDKSKKIMTFGLIGLGVIFMLVVTIVIIKLAFFTGNDKSDSSKSNSGTENKTQIADSDSQNNSHLRETDTEEYENQQTEENPDDEYYGTYKDVLAILDYTTESKETDGNAFSIKYPSDFEKHTGVILDDIKTDYYVLDYDDVDQTLYMIFDVGFEEDTEYLSDEIYYMILATQSGLGDMAKSIGADNELRINDYSIKQLGDNYWCSTTSFDDLDYRDAMATVFCCSQNNKMVFVTFFVTKEDVGSERYFDYEDLKALFEVMADSVTMG